MSNNDSIKDTLDVIRRALEDENPNDIIEHDLYNHITQIPQNVKSALIKDFI